MSLYDGTIGLVDGTRLNLLDPDSHIITISGIADGISKLCRFGGQCEDFYSVAEHCVHVSYAYDNPEEALAGLLHDGSEAFMQDLVSPLKVLLPEYVEIETNLQHIIFRKYHLDISLLDKIHNEADRYAAYVEGAALTRQKWAKEVDVPEQYSFIPLCWSWKIARDKYLQRFYQLQKDRS